MPNALSSLVSRNARRPYRLSAGAAALAAVAILASACGSSSSGGTAAAAPSGAATSSAASSAPAASGASVTTVQTSLGTVLANSKGQVLYMLTSDKNGTSSCNSACLSAWPAATASGTPTAGSGVTAKLGTTASQGGGQLITANGHPLYTYAGDSGPGQATGQGITSFGGAWWVLSPSGTPITGSAGSSSSSSSTTSSGYGNY
jgi:predicted lipoprotein with Yx(FWY)xxD motif